MIRKVAAVVLISQIIFFSFLSMENVLISGDNNPLAGGEEEPLGTIDWKTLSRDYEPVVVSAFQVPDLIGTSVNSTDVFMFDNDILVYTWNGTFSTWRQIPFQVDERNFTTGSFGVNNSNGILDGIDEIVFMSQDTGDRASSNEWVVGCDAPRYEIEITDPDTGDSAWVYIYKSNRIEADFTEDYVRFDYNVNDVFTESYSMGFRDGFGMVMDYFNVTELKGGDGENLVDVLEIEAIASVGIFTLIYDENDLASDFTLKKDGYVRALGVVNWHIHQVIFSIIVDAYFNFTWKFYQEHVNVTGFIDISIDGPVRVNISMALDHISTAIPLDYRDVGGNMGVLNGLEDDIIVNPDVQGWWEVSGPHGGYVYVWDVDIRGDSSKKKFDDNSTAVDHDNAEPGVYGRTGGLFVNITHYQTSYGNISIFPIPSNTPSVAEQFAYIVNHPLLITTIVQNSPTIWVEKISDVDFAEADEFVTYTIYLNNTGDRTTNFVWINDTLPLDVTFIGHDADLLPFFVGLNQITNTLYFEFNNVPPGVHYFDITVSVDPSAVPGQTLTNWVYCNFTNHLLELMPESIASASFEVLAQNYLSLRQGWNLISIPFIQSDKNLGTVLSSIDGLYDSVQWYDAMDTNDHWKHNKEGKLFGNDLFELDETMGFWIHITPPGVTFFPYNGTEPSVNQHIPLYPGWNLVGYPSLTNYDRTDGLNNLTFDTHVDSIWSYNSSSQEWKEMEVTDYFEVGRGYYFHVKTSCVWEVPL